MDEFDYGLVADFLGQNWAAFLDFADQSDVDELACEDLLRALETEAGRT